MGCPQIGHFGTPITGIQMVAAVLHWTGLEEMPPSKVRETAVRRQALEQL